MHMQFSQVAAVKSDLGVLKELSDCADPVVACTLVYLHLHAAAQADLRTTIYAMQSRRLKAQDLTGRLKPRKGSPSRSWPSSRIEDMPVNSSMMFLY